MTYFSVDSDLCLSLEQLTQLMQLIFRRHQRHWSRFQWQRILYTHSLSVTVYHRTEMNWNSPVIAQSKLTNLYYGFLEETVVGNIDVKFKLVRMWVARAAMHQNSLRSSTVSDQPWKTSFTVPSSKTVRYDTFLQYFDTVGWVFWPVKTISHTTYTVLVGT